jgi:hypothetical protein
MTCQIETGGYRKLTKLIMSNKFAIVSQKRKAQNWRYSLLNSISP